MGYLNDVNYPAVFHLNHGWIFFFGEDDRNIWTYDSGSGWAYTKSEIYPWIYHFETKQWLLFDTGTQSPHRSFKRANGEILFEEDLN
jgi:hypothetical protein